MLRRSKDISQRRDPCICEICNADVGGTWDQQYIFGFDVAVHDTHFVECIYS